jgi:hypothetical protein
VWSDEGRLPELDSLTTAGDVILDSKVVVITADGSADFDVLGTSIQGRQRSKRCG